MNETVSVCREDVGAPWLAVLARPLPESPCGEDPRYWDEFAFLKGEIEKLQGADFDKVWDLGRELLASRTRDLRIAGYLVLAGLITGGIPRLLESVRGYRLLLEHFAEGCHPRSPAARTAALRWLNQPRVESFARRFAAGAEARDLSALQQEIDGINHLLHQRMGEDPPLWSVLNPWIQEGLRASSPPPVAQPAVPLSAPSPGERDAAPAPPPPPESPATAVGSPGIDSERELTAAARQIRDYLRRQKEELRGVFFARALRWGSLGVPPHQNGRTRIPAPRKTGWAELEKGRAARDWEAVLQGCENLFHEPGGQFDLDLQALAAEAARALGRRELTEFIADQTALLVRRLPELPRLSFEDGRPFASAATRQWLQGLGKGSDTPAQAGEWEAALAERLEEAREVLRERNLEEGLRRLQEISVGDEKQRFVVRLAQGRLCLEGARPELALPLLEELHESALAKSLHLWEKGLALSIWSALLETCRMLISKGREDLRDLAGRVEGLICRTDPVAAAALI